MKSSQLVSWLLGGDDCVEQILGEAYAPRPPRGRLHLSGLTQKETAFVLGLSERCVRNVEIRALRKLKQHPKLRDLWRQYLGGELGEAASTLTASETQALLGLARNRTEWETILKVLSIVQG